MAKDKILKDWVEFQQTRHDKMPVRVRVEIQGDCFYAKLKITSKYINIDPFDLGKDVISLSERRLVGVNEINSKGIQLIQRCGKPNCTLFFRTERQRNKALQKMRSIIGADSTSSSSSSSSN